MATPNRAPRRTAAQMNVNVASGVPSPGANTYQAARKTASASDAGKACDASHSPSGVTPTGFPDTKVNK